MRTATETARIFEASEDARIERGTIVSLDASEERTDVCVGVVIATGAGDLPIGAAFGPLTGTMSDKSSDDALEW
jgi:hypothetical protein